jgi:hypothetical protein
VIRRDRRWPAITAKRRRRRALWREIRRIAQDDLDQVAVSIGALESSVAAIDGPARDSYYAAVGLHPQADEQLVVAESMADARQVARLASRARCEIACAQARVDAREPPQFSAPRFFDPAHGPAEREVCLVLIRQIRLVVEPVEEASSIARLASTSMLRARHPRRRPVMPEVRRGSHRARRAGRRRARRAAGPSARR